MVAPRFEPLDVGRGDPQRGVFGVLHDGTGEVRTRVEQVVLDLHQDLAQLFVGLPDGHCDAECGVGLVAVGVGHQARITLLHT